MIFHIFLFACACVLVFYSVRAGGRAVIRLLCDHQFGGGELYDVGRSKRFICRKCGKTECI
jgi:hypothetical protein